jgi:hypothetical protein
MADVKSAWNDAGDQLQNLGASLKQHYAQQRGEDAGQTKEQVGDAFKKVGEALQGAFDALGAAAKDPAVKADVKQTGKSVADALTVTFTELSDDVRKAFDKRKGEPGDDATPTREPGESGTPWGTAPAGGAPAAGADETPAPSAQWTAPATSDSTAAPAGAQEHGVDGGTAPQTPAENGSPQDRQDPTSNI